MSKHFKIYSAVFPILLKDGKILLHKRKNTGYMDGKWDLAGTGHVEEGETAREAVVRECFEELGININVEDVEFCHLSHRVGISDGFDYNYIYFIVSDFSGNPTIKEKDKNAEIRWFNLDDLPADIIPDRKEAIKASFNGIYYSEWTA